MATALKEIFARTSWSVVVLGAQWGDEGKGAVIDYLAGLADVVYRFNGGANAGHTIVVDGKKEVLHLLPSGIIRPGVMNLVGPGVVCDPAVLVEELAIAARYGSRVMLDPSAIVVTPLHKLLDAVREEHSGAHAIGTTKRGIGPAYEDLVARRGVRLGDLASREAIVAAFNRGGYLAEKRALLNALGVADVPTCDELVAWAEGYRALTQYFGDTRAYLAEAVASGKRVLGEGAQGIMLDVLHGSQPYTTSSGCTLGALSAAMGIYRFDAVIGVAKAYATRVGAGPFPTCLTTVEGEELRRRGNEYGATTGRPRACGWIDLPALSYACRVGGVTHLILTKLDILSDFPTDIAVCSEYRYNGRVVLHTETLTTEILEGSELDYTTFAPWSTADLQAARTSERVQSYLAFIERSVGVSIGGIKTSPERTALTLFE